MVDMGQAERTLRSHGCPQARPSFDFIYALGLAAKAMGFEHYSDVPDDQVKALKAKAHTIRTAVV